MTHCYIIVCINNNITVIYLRGNKTCSFFMLFLFLSVQHVMFICYTISLLDKYVNTLEQVVNMNKIATINNNN